MTIKRRVVRKKKKNEASEALAKVSGVEELEMAANILKELAQRKQRKGKIEKQKEQGIMEKGRRIEKEMRI